MSSTLKLFFTALVISLMVLAIYSTVTGAKHKSAVRRDAILKTMPEGL